MSNTWDFLWANSCKALYCKEGLAFCTHGRARTHTQSRLIWREFYPETMHFGSLPISIKCIDSHRMLKQYTLLAMIKSLLFPRNYRTWILMASYGFSFGIELTADNVLSAYFQDYFGQNYTRAGDLAAVFGLLNIVSRPLGMFSKFLLSSTLTIPSILNWTIAYMPTKIYLLRCQMRSICMNLYTSLMV